MLAQNFKTPADLDLTEVEFDALAKVLGMLERGDLTYAQFAEGDTFNMGFWQSVEKCGTIGCICGWANHVSGGRAFRGVGGTGYRGHNESLRDLFIPFRDPNGEIANAKLRRVTMAQAATALRSYLTSGDARWDEAMASL